MEMYVTYLTTREDLYYIDIDQDDWDSYVATLPDYPAFDVNEAYNHFSNLGYLEVYADGETVEQVVERVEFSE